MSRDNRRRTERAATDLRPSAAPQIQRNARFLTGRGNDQANREAQALINAFGAGTQLAGAVLSRRAERFAAEGRQAALEGRELTEDEKRHEAALGAYNEVMDARDFAKAEAGLLDEIEKLDVVNMKPEEFQGFLDERAQTFLGDPDLDDPIERASAQRQSERWLQFEQKANAYFREVQTEAVQRELEGAVSVAVQHELDTTGTLDLEAWNTRAFQMWGPQEANAELVAVVTSVAIRDGRPELIEELQSKKHWEGGAAAPGGIRDFDGTLQNALNTARAQKQYNARIQEADDARATEERADEIGREVFGLVFGNKPGSAQQTLSDAVQSGEIDPDAARTWSNWIRANQSVAAEDFQTAPAVFSDVSIRVATGDITVDELAGMARNRELSATDLNRFTSTLRAVKSAERNDPMYQARWAEFDAEYSAPRDYEVALPIIEQERAQARVRALELMGEEGLPQTEAMDRVRQEMPAKDVDYWKRLRTNQNQASEQDIIGRLGSGESVEGILNHQPNDMSRDDYINDLIRRYNLTPAQIDELEEQLGAN